VPETHRRHPRRHPLALAAACCLLGSHGVALAQAATPRPPARAASAPAPIELRALEIRGRPDLETVAEGQVQLKRGAVELLADWLSYEQAEDVAWARGQVVVRNPNGVYRGPELRIAVQRFEGYFLQPEFDFPRLKAGGRAERIDFLDSARSVVRNASYTSCPREGPVDPPWVLRADRIKLDTDADEGQAEGAVLRFLGVPILALPAISFPLGDRRKSGWLPPSVDIDSKSGLTLEVPYYWNIAPNRDATLTPRVITRRGIGLDAEFRYLEPGYRGQLRLDWLPDDRVAARSRSGWQLQHEGELPWQARWRAEVAHVSDDNWWKDFPGDARSLTPRLLPQVLHAERPFTVAGGDGLAYASLQRWQVLQGSDAPVLSPYQRSPQLGVQLAGALAATWDYSLQTEANRFTLTDRAGSATEPTGWRWHAVGALARTWRGSGWWLTPRASFNAARYSLDQAMADGRQQASRVIPTLSVDAGMVFERSTRAFGRDLRQTLEPRLRLVGTPFRAQSGLPNFDSAGKDFNFDSIFSDNAFSGIDRVSDTRQLTAGVTTRLVDPASGVEALRLGIVQRYLFSTQHITPEGVPFTRRFSDLFLLGSTSVLPAVALDGALQYSPDIQRPMRSIVSVRYQPGPFRTVSATYRFTRGLTEQLEVGWQWPLWKAAMAPGDGVAAAGRGGSGSCRGTWYGVGRVNYSLRDSRITDSVLGFEYDAGCWIGRVVAERLSTGRSEATTRLLLQLELVGLSRLGSNPLKVLKDNIPGYRLLREERSDPNPAPVRYE